VNINILKKDTKINQLKFEARNVLYDSICLTIQQNNHHHYD